MGVVRGGTPTGGADLSAERLVVRCPAKVNLRLRVLQRRPDGFHELDTLFQAVDLWDTVEGSIARGLTLLCSDPRLPTDERNLVLRAASALRAEAGDETLGCALRLTKRIPVGGGLGGGSSDAAGTLYLLDRLWRLGLGTDRLSSVASGLGSDVVFFLHGGMARGRGRGERIDPLEFPGSTALVLGFPGLEISTAEVYRKLAEHRLTAPGNDVSLSRPFPLKLHGGKDFGFAVNDLEPLVFREWPELATFRDALLEAGAGTAMLSGSGSTVFGLFQRTEQAREAEERLRAGFPRWTVISSRTVEHAVRVDEDGPPSSPARGGA